MHKINFAIIGCGKIGARHAQHIQQVGNLLAVCDIVKSRAEELSSRFSCNAYLSIDDLLNKEKGIDVVAICTPNGLHAEHAIKALQSQCHVLCEKPMAITSGDCKVMIETAIQANRKLFIVKQNRFNPPVVAFKNLLTKGLLGKIYSIQVNCFWNRDVDYYQNSWRGSKQHDGGTLFTQFSHFIDLIYWLFGEIEHVHAFIDNFHHKNIIEFEDTGVAVMKFRNGIIGSLNYTVNSHEKNMEGSLTVFGERGTIKIGGEYLNKLEYENIDGYKIEPLVEGAPPNDYGTYKGSMSNHNKVYENVIDVLQNNAEIAANAFDGLKTVEIIERIYKAACIK